MHKWIFARTSRGVLFTSIKYILCVGRSGAMGYTISSAVTDWTVLSASEYSLFVRLLSADTGRCSNYYCLRWQPELNYPWMNIPSDIMRSNTTYIAIFIACSQNARYALLNIVACTRLNRMIYKWIFATCPLHPTDATMNNTAYCSIFIVCPPNAGHTP